MTHSEQDKAGAAKLAGSDQSPVEPEQARNASEAGSQQSPSAPSSTSNPASSVSEDAPRKKVVKPSPAVLQANAGEQGGEAMSFDPGDQPAARQPSESSAPAPQGGQGPRGPREGAPRGDRRGPGGPRPGGPRGDRRGPGGPGGGEGRRGANARRGPGGGPGGRDGERGRDGDRGNRLRRGGAGLPHIVRTNVPIPIQPFLEDNFDDTDLEKELGKEMAAFDKAVENYLPDSINEFSSGDMVDAIVVAVREDDVLLDVGDKAECLVSADEFKENGVVTVKPGDTVKVLVAGRGSGGSLTVSYRKAIRFMGLARIQEAQRNHEVLQGEITKEVKGGLIVEIDGVQAFLPASQVDMQRVDDLASWIGKEVKVYVIDYIRERKRVIVSHREFLEEEHNHIRDAVISELKIGEITGATVKSLTDFGVFVDLGGGVDGLIPREEVSWEKGGHPSSYLAVGDAVTVKVLSITKTERKTKISLSRKQAKADPFEILPVKYPPNSEVDGEIVGITHFGAFVRIEEGIQGMIHVSDLSWSGGNKRVKDFVKLGDKVRCQVLEIDTERRRLSLGLKQLQNDPWELIDHRFPIGSRVKGEVTSLVQYGAFVKISDDLEGLVHISDFSWDKKVTKPSQMLKKGDEVECVVLAIDSEERRLSLGVKQMTASPFDTFTAAYNVGDTVEGKVTKIESFGAFVEVSPGVEGLLHVSQISEQRVEDPSQVLKPGETVQVKVTKIDRKNEKISLSRREVLRDLEKHEIETYMQSSTQTEAKGPARATMMGESLMAALLKANVPMPQKAEGEEESSSADEGESQS